MVHRGRGTQNNLKRRGKKQNGGGLSFILPAILDFVVIAASVSLTPAKVCETHAGENTPDLSLLRSI